MTKQEFIKMLEERKVFYRSLAKSSEIVGDFKNAAVEHELVREYQQMLDAAADLEVA